MVTQTFLFQFMRPSPPEVERVSYYNLQDVRKESSTLPSPWLMLPAETDTLAFAILDGSQVKIKVSIDTNLKTNIDVLGFRVPQLTGSIEKTKLSVLLNDLLKLKVCTGVTDEILQELAPLPTGEKLKYFRHVTYRSVSMDNGVVHMHDSTIRSCNCDFLIPLSTLTGDMCKDCITVSNILFKKHHSKTLSDEKPMHKNTPLAQVSKKKLAAALKTVRKSEARLQKQVNEFKDRLPDESIELNKSLHQDLKSILESSKITDPLAKLFWAEQMKAFKCKDRGMRWHPMLIRLAILLHSRSPAAYETLRKTGVLKLPGQSTLRDYTNVIHPKTGFSPEVLEELEKLTKGFGENQRYVVLLHDEMAIKSDLVFDRRSGEILGFVNVDTWSFDDFDKNLANHVLVFYIVGVTTSLKMSLGFFATRTATADEMFPLFWQAVGYLETRCKLKVIASTSDKASPNQKLYRLHGDANTLCYKTINFFAPDRYIYFFSDVPHLVKTVRNNIHSSGSGTNTKYLWNNGKYILWTHILNVYKRDSESHLQRTKLTADHVQLTPYSVMNVRLAAQVLSARVGKTMRAYGGPDCQETAKFVLLMDRFFDCLNTRSETEGVYERKPDLLPYKDIHDDRFVFLEKEFLGYLNQWKESTQVRQGEYTKTQRSKMFLTSQTYDGLCMTVHSFVEVTRYLLTHGVKFVLSQVFCQDPLEEHFGRHRGMGQRSDNPNLWAFGYQENKIRLQRTLALQMQPRGNVSHKKRQKPPPVAVSHSPLKKIRRR